MSDSRRMLNRHQREARTMLHDAGVVAAILEGSKARSTKVRRIASSELRVDLAVLQTRINALRVSIEPPEAET